MFPPKTRANVGMVQCIFEGHGKPPVYMSDSSTVLSDIYTVVIAQLFPWKSREHNLTRQCIIRITIKGRLSEGAFILTLFSCRTA